MPRRRPTDLVQLLPTIARKIRSPACIVLGSPREAVRLVENIECSQIDCFQMDLFQADRLRDELVEATGAEIARVMVGAEKAEVKKLSLPLFSSNGGPATAHQDIRVVTGADLWDLPPRYHTLLYPAPEKGERSLKLDMIEQAYHTLQPQGTFIVLSPYAADDFFRTAIKKVFGKGIHSPQVEHGSVFWCQRGGERSRRRHEITFQIRTKLDRSLQLASRPGVFSYGRLDDGARALVEVMEIEPGDSVLDLGCGIGSNGIHAALQSGPDGFTIFLDSNVRAVALAELNARAHGLSNFRTIAAADVNDVERDSIDVVLANPPYYAQGTIAERFILDALQVLKPGGRLYLVTKQLDVIGTMVAETFGDAEAVETRGYVVVIAQK